MDFKKIFTNPYFNPGIGFVKTCLKDVSELRKKPRIVDYVSLIFSFKENFDTSFNLKEPYIYFNNPNWKCIFNDSFCDLVCSLITGRPDQRLTPVASAESVCAFIQEIHGIRFGWVTYNDEAEKIFVERDKYNEYAAVLYRVFWEKYSSNSVVLGITGTEDNEKIYVRNDIVDDKFYISSKSESIAEYVRKFLEIGVGRSMLFYGPPGSGKSRIAKSITELLKLKTIRINNIAKISFDTLLNILNIFNPDAILIEDIDNIETNEVADLLDKLEKFNKRNKVVIATANQVSKLDNALVRPERFDRLWEINHLEEEVIKQLINNDPELYEIVKEFPAAYTIELLNRIKALGRETALTDFQDLTDRIANFERSNYQLRSEEEIEE